MNDRTQVIMLENIESDDIKIMEIVANEKSRLLNFIRQRTQNIEDAEDILQDVFYELIESYRMMKPVEKLVSWMFTVARNKITDSYRKKKPIALDDAVHLSEDADEPLFLADLLQGNSIAADDKMMCDFIMETIANALDELPKEQHDAFVMHELEDKSMQQIADEMNVPIKTVISRKRYAVLHLRERLLSFYKQILND